MSLEVPVPDDQLVRACMSMRPTASSTSASHRETSLTLTPSRWPRLGAGSCPAREGLFTVTGYWIEGEPVVVAAHPCRPQHDQESWLAEGAWQVTVQAISPEGAQMQALAQVHSEQPGRQSGPLAVRHLRPEGQSPAHAATGR
jgi:hypothetical protein